MSPDPAHSLPLSSEDGPNSDWVELWAQAGWLRKFARQLGCEAHAAEDAVQEALLSAREALGDEATSPSMRGWLRKAVKRRIGTGRRADARRRVRERLAAKAEGQPGDALGALEREELGEQLAAAVAGLPVRDRELVALRYAAGMGPSAIATSMGLTPDAVSSRLSRIHRRVRERLERDEITPLEGRLAAPLAAITAIVMKKSVAVAAVGLLMSAFILTWRDQQEPVAQRTADAAPLDVANALDSLEPSVELALVAVDAERTQVDVVREAAAVEPVAEPAAPLEKATTGSLRVHVTWRDGSPAAGVATLLSGNGTIGSPHADRWQVTDHAGVIELSHLRPEEYTVEADRGGKVDVDVVAGGMGTATLALTEGYDVHGVVRDVNDVPVAGASIIASSWRYNWRGARVVGTTDSHGRFTVRSVDDGGPRGLSGGRALSATAPGWAPSKPYDLSRLAASAVDSEHSTELDLRLTERGADVFGTVTDPAGAPVEGVMVAIGSATMEGTQFHDHPNEQVKPRVVTTDAEGRYRLDGIAPGLHVLAAQHADWPVWSTEFEFAARSRSQHNIVLEAGVTVLGTVRLRSGEPAAGAILLALPEPFVDPYPGQGPTDSGSPFSHRRANADANGDFEIRLLQPGTLHLYASLGTAFLTPWSGKEPPFQGSHQQTLDAAPGERVEWNPQLALGLTISGRAVYADGTPVQDAFVTAIEPGGGDSAVSTNMEGTFVIPNLEKVPHRVTFQMPDDAPKTESVEVFYDIVPPAKDVVFQLGYSPGPKLPMGTLRLRVKDTADLGAALGDGAIVPVVHSEGSLYQWMGANEEGVFETKLAPGVYRIALGTRWFSALHGEQVEVISGEALDLGTLETVAFGSLEVTIARPEGFEGPVVVRPRQRSAAVATVPAGSSTGMLPQIAPGNGWFTVTGEGLVRETVKAEILPGARSQVSVQLRRANRMTIECTLRQPRGFRRLEVTVTDAAGKAWHESASHERHVKAWPHVIEQALPVGTYTVRIACADGQVGEATLVIEDTGPRDPFRVHAR